MRNFTILIVGAIFVALFSSAAAAQNSPASFRADNANVHSRPGGQALTLPSQASAPSVVAEFLGNEGLSRDTVASLVLQSENSVARTGLTHLRFGQRVEGLSVFGAYVKATVNGDGALVHLIEALARPNANSVVSATIGSRTALDAAMAKNHPGVGVTLSQAAASGNTVSFSGDDFFYDDPRVTRVAVAMNDGALQEGFLVETWSAEDNFLYHTLIGPNGRVLDVELRTNNDSYNIFPIHPDISTQTDTAGPGAGNIESPGGWLFGGNHQTVDIAGNNVNAYLDTDANNASDGGGATVSDGIFGATADLSLQPSNLLNQDVAVQNLFYFNNLIHDKLYRHGFDEAAGNFQEDNFGNGGSGSDSVNAEAQDGRGTNNANFATPSDGFNPRMQMYLWTSAGDHLVDVTAGPEYIASGANFGPSLQGSPLTDDVVAGLDGTGTTTDGCEALTNGGDVNGKIALFDRGNCTFTVKVKNAQNAGAVGAIIANNQGDGVLTMGGTDGTVNIPSVLVGQSDGADLRASLPKVATLKVNPEGVLMRDGDVDSDIIYHEYGHGLTWRMIGSMSGAMPGAIGEGMSDVLAILINDDDVVGEYSTSDSIGIRSAPYTNYTRTYGDFIGGANSVHSDGEIYAATIWRLWELFQTDGLAQDTLFDYLIGGMNFTPAGPAFEDMRDGILIAAGGTGHECQIWKAFAAFGVGVGADYVGGSNVTESFVVPAEYSGSCSVSNAPPTTSDTGANGPEDSVSIAIVLNGSDSDGTVASFSLTSLPVNGSLYTNDLLNVSASTGMDYAATLEALTLYFVPDANFNGDTTFQFAAKDDVGAVDGSPATATVTVTPVNDAPVAAVIANQNDVDGGTVSVDASTTDVDDASLTYTATGLPLGLSIGFNDGQITGTIDANASQGGLGGVYAVVVTAHDAVTQTDYPSFDWTVTSGGGGDTAPTEPPTIISAIDLGGGFARITWSDTNSNETGFELQREKKVGNSSWKGLTLLGTTTAMSYDDDSGKGTFRYYVRAFNGTGTGPWSLFSNEVPVTGGGGSDPGTINCNKKANRELDECTGG